MCYDHGKQPMRKNPAQALDVTSEYEVTGSSLVDEKTLGHVILG